ncbi:ammonium transporter [Flavobacterium agricola]|uniref:Ammonium transporter n=1 Tax=Flavobacterium agricola TaxID=2870839 RepID=A0ABY6LWX4_9FLAO|nr:ammonium transporter [Flavobacterium agricola]UYW00832.1 ammonium transporter [Flavobacterium agricola]
MNADVINNGNVAFMVITTVLVFLMIPGLAFFYGGLVPKKNTLTMMMYTFISIGVVTVLWTLGGFSMVFGNDIGGFVGSPTEYFMLNGVDFTVNPKYGSSIPFLMFFMYQLMFAIITAPLMTGAIAGRITIFGWVKVLVLWMILIYFPVAHWIWGGGFLSKLGFVDYAGGTVIHATAGFSALVGVLFFGKRYVMPKRDYGNINLVLIGTALLMFGWFGFNSGGALASGETAAIAFTNTGIAAGFATVVWVLISYSKTKKFSMVELATGAVAGLATITPASGYVTPQTAVFIGIIAAVICYLCLEFSKKMKWDDALGVWGVHGMGGVTGSILVGVFAASHVNGVSGGMDQFLIQLLGVAIVIVYSVVVCWIIFKVCDLSGSIRVPAEVQEKGLDKEYLLEEQLND